MIRVRHLTRYRRCGGGLQRHLDVIAAQGAEVIGMQDALPASFSNPPSVQRSARHFRAVWAREFAALEPVDVAVYHNGWGMDLLGNVDRARIRICWIHSDFPNLDVFVRHFAPYADAFVAVHPGIEARIARENPWIPGRRNRTLRCPVEIPQAALESTSMERPDCVVGYVGRLEKRQKRVERLVPFWDTVRQRIPDARFELLGDGRARRWLEKRWRDDLSVSFLGELPHDRIWEVFHRWRYLVFPSSYEGLPLALIEAAAAGVVPIYPNFHGEAEPLYAVDPRLLYPLAEMDAAAEILIKWDREYPRNFQAFTARSPRLWQPHALEAVSREYERLIDDLADLRQRQPRAAGKGVLWCPLWYYNRFYRFLLAGSFF